MSDRQMIHAFMVRLVEKAGGVDKASMLISARMGEEIAKGTISKRVHGLLRWPLDEIMALEDAVGDPCVRRWLARSLPEVTEARGLMDHAAQVAREGGEALAATLAFASGSGKRAEACREVQEAIVALTRLGAVLEIGGEA